MIAEAAKRCAEMVQGVVQWPVEAAFAEIITEELDSEVSLRDREIRQLREVGRQLAQALDGMMGACDEWAAEFTQNKRAMNWGVVNEAYMGRTAARLAAVSLGLVPLERDDVQSKRDTGRAD